MRYGVPTESLGRTSGRAEQSMDSNDSLKQEVLDVRKVIEKSTSKVSLRDLEKKGFRQVKVLRAGDINQLIFKAVQNVLAKQPRGAGLSDEEKQRILQEAKAEVDQKLAEARRMAAEQKKLEEEKEKIEEANRKLQEKVDALNRQFMGEKKALEKEKQALYERSMAGQEATTKNYEAQVAELRQALQRAEARAEGAVPKGEYDRLRERFERLESDLEAAEQKAREARAALQEAESRGGSAVLDTELQRMRFEIEQRDASMRDLITGLATTLQTAGPPAGQSGEIDMSKQFKALQLSISDQIRKSIGSGGGKGGFDVDLTPEAAAALFAQQADVKLETNVKDVVMKEQKAEGVQDKLNKLKRLKGK